MLAHPNIAIRCSFALLACPLQSTERVSVGQAGVQGADSSGVAALADGERWVAFTSLAENFSTLATRGVTHVFVRDRQLGTTTLASISTGNAAANADCFGPVLAGNGRWVAFRSAASNLVPGDANGVDDVFVHDLLQQATQRASVAFDGGDANAWSYYQQLSFDGRFVCFLSEASNLVPADSNATFDVFVRDMQTQATELVSLATSGAPTGLFEFSVDPSISGDGRRIAFASVSEVFDPGSANGQMDVFLRDRALGTTQLVSLGLGGVPANGASELPSISSDGRCVAFVSSASNLVPGDTNGVQDVFVRDLAAQVTQRVSVSSSGVQASQASWLYYSHNTISGDGSRIAFESYAPELVLGDANAWSDVFVHDRSLQQTWIASVSSSGQQIHLGATRAAISIDGRCVAFESNDAHLVAGDTNAVSDVFLRLLHSVRAPIVTLCQAMLSPEGCLPTLSAAGQPSLGGSAAFQIALSGAPQGMPGIVLAGLAPLEPPFGTGGLCVDRVFERSPLLLAVDGQGKSTCAASCGWTVPPGTLAAAGLAGTPVHVQWVGRRADGREPATISSALSLATGP